MSWIFRETYKIACFYCKIYVKTFCIWIKRFSEHKLSILFNRFQLYFRNSTLNLIFSSFCENIELSSTKGFRSIFDLEAFFNKFEKWHWNSMGRCLYMYFTHISWFNEQKNQQKVSEREIKIDDWNILINSKIFHVRIFF